MRGLNSDEVVSTYFRLFETHTSLKVANFVALLITIFNRISPYLNLIKGGE